MTSQEATLKSYRLGLRAAFVNFHAAFPTGTVLMMRVILSCPFDDTGRLAEKLNVTGAAITNICARLREAGYLRSISDPTNGKGGYRQLRHELTEAGETIFVLPSKTPALDSGVGHPASDAPNPPREARERAI